MSPSQVLIIDDEADVCTFFSRLLTRKGYGVVTAGNEPEAMRALEGRSFSVAMVDLKLPDTDGLTLLQMIKTRQPACEVILMTGYSTVKTAVTAMQLGAYEYLEKPFDDIGEIEALIEKAASHGAAQQNGNRATEEWSDTAQAVGFRVGTAPSMRRLVSLAYKIATKNINVLIQGKTGTGKEVLARFIHAASGRADQPFIPVNCGALPENLLESELFGHEKGAFTGASQTRRGIFELANRGTLLLDEIGDASPQIQVKLLRVLETGEFMRVGGGKAIKTDVRVIAATNVDLEEAIREKTFREDLYYRLNVVRLEIPPLRARADDIPQLAEHFARQHNADIQISPAAMRLLREYGWPGNIRELANVMRRAVVMSSDGTILPEHLGSRFLPGATDAAKTVAPGTGQNQEGHKTLKDLLSYFAKADLLAGMSGDALQETLVALHEVEAGVLRAMRGKGVEPDLQLGLKETEADAIRRALEQCRRNITETAKVLGIGRNTLYRKIRQYNLGSLS
ncbi:sigma-54-dependent transcriptional regulator [Geobacter argillaceus]|uniref:Two component Fis family sigma54 specific transcriptional regulator n=1 Tax=Geobacter argillaceus TaxID=345631 RepID=A0A562VM74_9BACT|nr:sigma-54 dependent transcriptional regulator [Geobacter argillaceus]TWJ19019.1 two component Fis family sigma54 specific transcriptional regulator [Geobacter argillaceus]